MNELKINGELKNLALSGEERFDLVMERVRSEYVKDNELVSSLKIDGMELTPDHEDEIAALPISNIKSVEILTLTPVEMAEDTLNTLEKFILSVVQISQEVSKEEDVERFENSFLKLIDGIQIIADTITAVKLTLRSGYNQTVAILEADLLDLLKDLVHAKETGLNDYMRDILSEHLPKNLMDWSLDGLHALMQAKGTLNLSNFAASSAGARQSENDFRMNAPASSATVVAESSLASDPTNAIADFSVDGELGEEFFLELDSDGVPHTKNAK